MKTLLVAGLSTLCLIAFVGAAQAAWDPNAEQEAQEAIADFKKADPSMEEFFEKAYGYAVFPGVGKGAVGIGGAHGSGVVYEQGNPIGTTTLTQVTVGLALGGQSFRQVIFFENKESLDKFTAGEFEFAAQASAVAATSGASANAAYSNGVAVFTAAKGGLMYEAAIGGQKFSFEAK
jgi:lipid-binding SYLF domain-containing protein